MEQQLRQAVERAVARPEVAGAVGAVYAKLQEEIDQRRPVCTASGRCCRFEEYGHRLYVTTIELAAFARGLGEWPVVSGQWPKKCTTSLPVLSSSFLLTTDHRPLATSPGCPFQIEGLCGVHPIRPFGCRVFFCDETATDWQQDAYERHHARLKRLHEELGVPYFYLEWRQALRALGMAGPEVAAV